MGQEPFQYSFMKKALELAQNALLEGEVPIGAVVVHDGNIIGRGYNHTRKTHDCTAHAEIMAIREACSHLQNERLDGCDLYVTLEPCTMCAGAISFARIRRLYFAVSDPKGGAIESGVRFFDAPTCHHKLEIYSGILEQDCQDLLLSFFQSKRS